MRAPDPGLHFDVPDSVYRSWDAVCQSDLGHLCNGRTLKHARYAIMCPPESTDAQFLGQAIHFAILQPALFEKNYAKWVGDRRTKKGREEWTNFQIKHAGKEPLKEADWDTCVAVREAVWTNPIVAEILGGQRFVEVSAVWEDPDTGMLCKGRIDVLTSHGAWTVVGDVKSTRNAAPIPFGRDVYNYGWYRQGAFYIDGLNVLDPRERLWLLIAVEKDPPYCAAVYELGYDDLEQGRSEYRKALSQWKEAEETGAWPGYPSDIQSLALPPWARRMEEE